MRTPQASDIHARGAYNGTSWSPEEREASDVANYLRHMADVRAEFAAWQTDANAEQLAADLEDYRSRYAAKLNAYLAAHSRVMSQFITGAGGWTGSMVRANDKRNDTVDRRRQELLAYAEQQLARLRRIYDPRVRARAAISSDDPDAVERLQAKIERAERLQETMREANKIVRRKISAEEKVAYLLELEGISEQTARTLLQPDYMGRSGFADYQLTNNGANIRRMQARVAELQARAAHTPTEREAAGLRYVEDGASNRVQLFFADKPDAAVRDELKANGFHWTPSIGAWQRQLNANGQAAAQRLFAKYTQEAA